MTKLQGIGKKIKIIDNLLNLGYEITRDIDSSTIYMNSKKHKEIFVFKEDYVEILDKNQKELMRFTYYLDHATILKIFLLIN